MAIGGKNIIDEKGKKFWADRQSEGLPLTYEEETKLDLAQVSIDDLILLLERNRFSARQLMMLGKAAGRLGNAWMTEMAFAEAIDMEPDNGQAYGDLIRYYAAQREWESCEKIWRDGMIKATEKYYLAYHYGRALYMQERYNEALTEAQNALTETNFGFEEAVLLALHSYLGKLAEKQSDDVQHDFNEAKQVWKAARITFPKSQPIAELEHLFTKDEFEE